ncbi:uncharacterized protein A1O9_07656 [Exophiala aquamarina CBS 119918]|uniref:SUZ-C domain-containing protein n=1 Tax=Exophiala aquamarina CBS 119918 TaxID=1182545 RepID=A0A072PKM1_9EURO|nr:uncharacterized protein A1O9_07656 [Exophiala aquamarina CBS 119918]KEF56075.1 hypothetical protein A1O9_07656 [Exophiala aquamarina CBS 119918]
MSEITDAWEDEWSNVADKRPPSQAPESKKPSSKVSKAQKRAQQAEFNRQLWAEAEGPKQTNYFLESRNVVPLRSEFKPPPVLLSRKGPVIQTRRPAPIGVEALSLNESTSSRNNEDSSEDEEDHKAKELSLAERQAQAVKDREEKQRKYEERRQELFGTTSSSGNTSQQHLNNANTRSGTSTPSSLTPPGSRSATPNRGGRGKGGRGGRVPGGPGSNTSTRNQSRGSQHRELYDPSHTPKPNREESQHARTPDIHPIRTPRGPNGSGRGGFGFSSSRAGHVSYGHQAHTSATAFTTSFNTTV